MRHKNKILSRLVCVFPGLCVSETSPAVIYAGTQFASCFSFSPASFSALFCQVHFPACLLRCRPPRPLLLFTFPAAAATTCFTLLFPLLFIVGHLRQQGSGQSRQTMKCQLLAPSSVAYLAASGSSWAIYPACQNQTNNGILYNVAISLAGKRN